MHIYPLILSYIHFLITEAMYYTPSPRANMVRKGLLRSYIWGCIKGNNASIGSYQPENDGYKVLSLYRGMQICIHTCTD